MQRERRRHGLELDRDQEPKGPLAAVAAHQPGDKVRLTVERGSRTIDTPVTLGTQPAQSATGG